MACKIVRIEGVRSSSRRTVVFLEDDADESVDAKAAFDDLDSKTKRDVLSRFEHWVDGGVHDDYHHGWNDEKYGSCYCFRWRRGTNRYRLYGFLVNPMAKTNPRHQVCVLAFYAQKNAQDTDKSILNELTLRKGSQVALSAINAEFPDGTNQVQRQGNGKKTLRKGESAQKLDRRKR
jgi:hypothetical protein